MKFTDQQILNIWKLCGYDATEAPQLISQWANCVNGGIMVEVMDRIAAIKEAPPQAQPRARRRLAKYIGIAPGPTLARA